MNIDLKPIIALDYDGTITLNIPFWINFIKQAEEAGFRVCIVTMRYPDEKDSMDDRVLEACPWLVTTQRRAKKEFCALFGIYPAIWIDDRPEFLLFDAADASANGVPYSAAIDDGSLPVEEE
jgi:hypothetical protein